MSKRAMSVCICLSPLGCVGWEALSRLKSIDGCNSRCIRFLEEGVMEISLRLDTLGIVETRYLRTRERYRDWPHFQLLAASRQARVFAYFTHEVAEQLHQQILMIESALGLDIQDEDDEDEGKGLNSEEGESEEAVKGSDRGENSAFSPAFAQALKQLNELARQRLPEASAGSSQPTSELSAEVETDSDEDALEQLQDAFIQMMEVVRELAEEMATDALKITGRFKCARTNIEFIPQALAEEEEDADDGFEDESEAGQWEEVEVGQWMVLQ